MLLSAPMKRDYHLQHVEVDRDLADLITYHDVRNVAQGEVTVPIAVTSSLLPKGLNLGTYLNSAPNTANLLAQRSATRTGFPSR